MTDDLARKMYLAEIATVREHLGEQEQTTPLRDRIAAALYERERPPRDPHWPNVYPADREVFEAMADAVLPVVLPATTDQTAGLRAVADRIEDHEPLPERGLAFIRGVEWVLNVLRRMADEADAELRRVADETAATETPEWDRPETEEEKLAKCRRMAKAMSAPPVAPPEWETTTEWPDRHKRPGDRRVHATARFIVNDTQRFWTACGEHVGSGGTPMSHMPVNCRGCKRATAAGARQDGAQPT